MNLETYERAEELFRTDSEPFETSDPRSLEFVDGDPSTSFGLADTTLSNGLHALLLEKDGWADWLAKSAQYRLHGLRLYEQQSGKTQPVEYDDALCAAVLSGHDDIIEEVIEEIQTMPDDLHEMGHAHDVVVRETVRCLAHLLEGDDEMTRRALSEARAAFEDAKAEDGLQLIEGDRTDRFVGTFVFVDGVLNDDPAAVEDAIQRMLDWHEREVFDGQTINHVARWLAMLHVIAQRKGFDPAIDHEYLPDRLLERDN